MERLKKVELLVEASVVPVEEERELEDIIEAAESLGLSREAAGPIGKDGKPRMLLITSWIVHEGRNDNGYAFVQAELDARVRQGLFNPPHGGLMDFNHDYTPIGFWYKASFAYHESAQKWGVLANGAIWAWRFPEVTDFLLAEQQREGNVKVSMACLAESSEFTHTYPGFEGDHTEVLHNPIFFTTSVLSVPPADPDATGTATEDATKPPAATAANNSEEVELAAASRRDNKEEVDMEELQEKLEAAIGKIAVLEAKVAELTSSNETLQAEASTAKQEAEAAQNALAEANEEKETLTTKVSEQEVALASAVEAREGLEKSLNEATEKLSEFEAKEAENAKQERLEARMAELPEVVRKNLEGHPEKEALLSGIASASDEDWNKAKTMYALATGNANYTGRSQSEGPLPSATGKTGLSSFDQYLR